MNSGLSNKQLKSMVEDSLTPRVPRSVITDIVKWREAGGEFKDLSEESFEVYKRLETLYESRYAETFIDKILTIKEHAQRFEISERQAWSDWANVDIVFAELSNRALIGEKVVMYQKLNRLASLCQQQGKEKILLEVYKAQIDLLKLSEVEDENKQTTNNRVVVTTITEQTKKILQIDSDEELGGGVVRIEDIRKKIAAQKAVLPFESYEIDEEDNINEALDDF